MALVLAGLNSYGLRYTGQDGIVRNVVVRRGQSVDHLNLPEDVEGHLRSVVTRIHGDWKSAFVDIDAPMPPAKAGARVGADAMRVVDEVQRERTEEARNSMEDRMAKAAEADKPEGPGFIKSEGSDAEEAKAEEAEEARAAKVEEDKEAKENRAEEAKEAKAKADEAKAAKAEKTKKTSSKKTSSKKTSSKKSS